MARSKPSKPGKPPKPAPKPAITPAQHQRVRQQLVELMAQINRAQTPPQLDRAGASLRPLQRRYPSLPEVAHVASGLHARRHELDQAIYHARRAVELAPDEPQYLSALGVLLVKNDQHAQAIAPLDRALAISPDLQQALMALGTAHMQTGDMEAARRWLGRAVENDPGDRQGINNLALLESDTGHAHRAVAIIEKALSNTGEDALLLDALCMFACYDDRLSSAQVYDAHERFGRCVAQRVTRPGSYPNDPDPDKRIRLGFVSPDLRTHSVAYFLEPIFEHLDPERFELFVYSTTRHPDAITARLRAHADTWRECTGGITDTLARVVADRVDVLVELTGHFAANLLPLFAAAPAPASVTMIGYANTTGLDSIDARIVDAITDPAPDADSLASETLVRVPGCFLCYRPPADAPDPADPDPARPFTFGSFNDLRKMSPSCLSLWARILGANPGSRLLLKTARLAHEQVKDQLRARLAQLGVEPSRVELLGRTDTIADHLALYNSVDCALDTFPYTGTTTTCEALHMGVPDVTLLGQAHAGRVSASLLTAAGRDDLIASDPDMYLSIATQHAQGGPRSRAGRLALRRQLADSPLCDPGPYTRKIEDALSRVWRSWCARQAGASKTGPGGTP